MGRIDAVNKIWFDETIKVFAIEHSALFVVKNAAGYKIQPTGRYNISYNIPTCINV